MKRMEELGLYDLLIKKAFVFDPSKRSSMDEIVIELENII
jgi:hypothetical protein